MIAKYGFILLSPGSDPSRHQTTLQSGGLATTIIAVPDPSRAPAIAAALVKEGVQLIELCGAFGPIWTAKVLEATEHQVPVGAVSYGVESISKLAALVADIPAT